MGIELSTSFSARTTVLAPSYARLRENKSAERAFCATLLDLKAIVSYQNRICLLISEKSKRSQR